MSKKDLMQQDIDTILTHISAKSLVYGDQKISGYAYGYLTSLLVEIADRSPAARKELRGHAAYLQGTKTA